MQVRIGKSPVLELETESPVLHLQEKMSSSLFLNKGFQVKYSVAEC